MRTRAKTKICCECKEEKTREEFHYKSKEKEYRQSICKVCLYTIQKKRWRDRKRKAIELLGGKCSKCGYNKNMAALDFHHLDPLKKEYGWNRLRLRKWESIIKEINKCILLCGNCHMELHWTDQDISTSNIDDNNKLNLEPFEMKPTGKCPKCKKDVYGTKYCSVVCSSFNRRKTSHPRKKTLAKLMENMSYCAIGRKYNVSDNAVRKWAKRYDLLS